MITRVISHVIYPEDCLRRAIEAYWDVLAVQKTQITPNRSVIELGSTSGSAPDVTAVHEFLNYLLDMSAEAHFGDALK